MIVRFFSVLFIMSFFNALDADVTLRFDGRDVKERLEINYWLSIQKKCPQAIMAVGLKMFHEILDEKQFAAFNEGMNITIPGKFTEYCPSSILTLDDEHGQFMLEDGCTYAIRLKCWAKPGEKPLKNISSKASHKAQFCVYLLSKNNS